MTTQELAERVMCDKGLDVSDVPLRNSVVYKVLQALRRAKRREAAGWGHCAGANTDEVKALRREAKDPKEVVAEQTLERNRPVCLLLLGGRVC